MAKRQKKYFMLVKTKESLKVLTRNGKQKVKKVAKMLKKASNAHAKQSKILSKLVKNGKKKKRS